MKLSKIVAIVVTSLVLCGALTSNAEIAQSDISEINRLMQTENGFAEASYFLKRTTANAVKSPKDFEQYLTVIGNGIKRTLGKRDIEFNDILGMGMIIDHLDNWARVIPGGRKNFTQFIETVADASKSARPASFGGQLGCQAQFVLYELAVEDKDIDRAEAARKAIITLSKYEGMEGVYSNFAKIIDVAFALISKDSGTALSLYRKLHKKLEAQKITEVEELLWASLTVLRENGTAFGEMEGVYKELNARFNKGLRVRRVFPNGAAAKAGWRKGDRIVEVDGKTLMYNSDDGGRGQFEAITCWRRITPNRKPTQFKLKRGESFFISVIADDALGIEY